jgi:hypothetical protein
MIRIRLMEAINHQQSFKMQKHIHQSNGVVVTHNWVFHCKDGKYTAADYISWYNEGHLISDDIRILSLEEFNADDDPQLYISRFAGTVESWDLSIYKQKETL